MKPNRDTAMEEVWAIKEKLWQEVAHLPFDEAIRERLRRANETAIRLGFGDRMVPPPGPKVVKGNRS